MSGLRVGPSWKEASARAYIGEDDRAVCFAVYWKTGYSKWKAKNVHGFFRVGTPSPLPAIQHAMDAGIKVYICQNCASLPWYTHPANHRNARRLHEGGVPNTEYGPVISVMSVESRSRGFAGVTCEVPHPMNKEVSIFVNIWCIHEAKSSRGDEAFCFVYGLLRCFDPEGRFHVRQWEVWN